MQRARRHQRFSAGLAFALLALIAELFRRSLTHRLNVGQPSARRLLGRRVLPVPAGRSEAPCRAAARAAGLALLARTRGRAGGTARARGRRQGRGAAAAPAVRPLAAPLGARVPHHLDLLSRPADAEQAASGRWPLFAPWLHTSALPVFAVLAVLVALAWGAVASWLREYERYAEDPWAPPIGSAVATASCRASRTPGRPRPPRESSSPWPSRAVRRPSPRNPRATPRARGTVSSRPGEVE